MIELKNSGVEYIDSTHQYFYEGKELTGITGLLHRLVFPDLYKNVDKTTLANAANRGSVIHEQIELFASLEIAPTAECVKQFVDFIAEQGYEIVGSEYVMLIGDDHASAADLVMHHKDAPDDEVEIWDIKTTYSVNKEFVRWQNSMYKYGLEKLNDTLKVSRICCMWLRDDNKRGTICKLISLGEPRPYSDIEALFRCEKENRLFSDEAKTPSFILENEEALLQVQEKLAQLKEEEERLKTAIFEGMEKSNTSSIKTSNYTYSLKSGSVRVSLDTKKFDADDKDTYNMLLEKYKKVTEVKPSLSLRRIV